MTTAPGTAGGRRHRSGRLWQDAGVPAPRSAPTAPVAQPVVARQIVLKVHSRCNLSCTYCYVYHHVDQGWRRQPMTLTGPTLRRVAERIGEHADRHRPATLSVVLHGGEPLLAGHAAVEAVFATISAAVPTATALRFSVQTNGVLLDDAYLELFHRHRVRVGVSVDGDAAANDRHRRYANGRGSFPAVEAALHRLARPEHRDVYAGLLCTVDVRNDPVRVYEALLEFQPPTLDLLLPHGNWTSPPPRPTASPSYAQWLIAVFDAWYGAPRAPTRIRLFESVIAGLLGGRSATEAVGGDEPGLVTIETDGSYEHSDALKTTVDGGAATGLSTGTHSIDELMAYLSSAVPSAPAPRCRTCPVLAVCGGGLRAHRYRAGNLFDNPSVYCADLFALIRHVEARVRADLSRR